LPIEKNGINPFSQTRKACTIVRLTFPPPPALPSASLLLRRQQVVPFAELLSGIDVVGVSILQPELEQHE